MNKTLDDLRNRRSIRRYKPEQITREELDEVLSAGVCAPTGMNRQSPIIVAVQDKETVKLLSKMNAAVMGASSDPFYGAPTVLVVLADAHSKHAVPDGSLVMGNLMNAAQSLGVASIWIHRAKEEFESGFGKKLLADLGIEGEYEGIGHCALGYAAEPAKEPAARNDHYIYYVR